MMAVLVIALVVIIGVSFFLALWKGYKDGIFGHAALVAMGACGVLMLIGIWHGYDFYYHPLIVGMLSGMAVFMARHTINALRFNTNSSEKNPDEHKA